jgi:transforming growth factor-beta-induced protein
MTTTFKALVLVALAGVAACSDSSPTEPSAASQDELQPGTQTIVAIVAQQDGEFDVLEAAVGRAGLAGTLSGTAQYTVFAPTDAAFVSSLGAADEAAAIAAVNGLPLDALRDILLYHVTSGRRNSTSVLAAPSYPMLNNKTLTRTALQAAGIAKADVSASNGIVHVINAVLIPAS